MDEQTKAWDQKITTTITITKIARTKTTTRVITTKPTTVLIVIVITKTLQNLLFLVSISVQYDMYLALLIQKLHKHFVE